MNGLPIHLQLTCNLRDFLAVELPPSAFDQYWIEYVADGLARKPILFNGPIFREKVRMPVTTKAQRGVERGTVN